MRSGVFVLRESGNNAGNNGRDLGDFRAYFYEFYATFTIYMNEYIVSMQKVTASIVSTSGNNRIRNASFLVRSLIRWKKVGLFARRINDLLSVNFLILSVGKHRINDRINNLSSALIYRINDRINGRMTKTY